MKRSCTSCVHIRVLWSVRYIYISILVIEFTCHSYCYSEIKSVEKIQLGININLLPMNTIFDVLRSRSLCVWYYLDVRIVKYVLVPVKAWRWVSTASVGTIVSMTGSTCACSGERVTLHGVDRFSPSVKTCQRHVCWGLGVGVWMVLNSNIWREDRRNIIFFLSFMWKGPFIVDLSIIRFNIRNIRTQLYFILSIFKD